MFVMADNFVFQNPAQRKLAKRYMQLPPPNNKRQTVAFTSVGQFLFSFFISTTFSVPTVAPALTADKSNARKELFYLNFL